MLASQEGRCSMGLVIYLVMERSDFHNQHKFCYLCMNMCMDMIRLTQVQNSAC